jgi:hypothetical protein
VCCITDVSSYLTWYLVFQSTPPCFFQGKSYSNWNVTSNHFLTLLNNNFTEKKKKQDICIFSSCTSISKFGLQKQQTPNKFISSIYLKIWDAPLWRCILQTANYFLYCGRLPSARNTTYVHATGTYTMWDLLKSNTVTWYVKFWGFIYNCGGRPRVMMHFWITSGSPIMWVHRRLPLDEDQYNTYTILLKSYVM